MLFAQVNRKAYATKAGCAFPYLTEEPPVCTASSLNTKPSTQLEQRIFYTYTEYWKHDVLYTEILHTSYTLQKPPPSNIPPRNLRGPYALLFTFTALTHRSTPRCRRMQ